MRKGFTLLELLIVITVIAILGAGIALSTIGIVTTADANVIISNMQQIKTATLIWYKNNCSRIIPDKDKNIKYKIRFNEVEMKFQDFIKDNGSEILKYIDNKGTLTALRSKSSSTNDPGDYSIIFTEGNTKWYVCYNLGTPDMLKKGAEAPDVRIREKIAGQAKKFGLLGKDSVKDDAFNGFYTNQLYVCMPILELSD